VVVAVTAPSQPAAMVQVSTTFSLLTVAQLSMPATVLQATTGQATTRMVWV
jgi:hypothetical protein